MVGNQTIKCCCRKMLSQYWGNHVKCQKKKPWWGGEESREQVAADSCKTSCKSTLKSRVVTQLEKHIPSLAGRSKGAGGSISSQACYANITHVRATWFNHTPAARGGESKAGAGLWHGAGTAGAPLLSRCGHPRCCGMQGEVVPLVLGYPVVLGSISSCCGM